MKELIHHMTDHQRYILKHKEVSVVEMEWDHAAGHIAKVGELLDESHLPMGVQVREGVIDRKSLQAWWMRRLIPSHRDGIREALEKLGMTDIQPLVLQSYGLSLSDHYWICPIDTVCDWGELNFFRNSFCEKTGNVWLGVTDNDTNKVSMSPDFTTNGWLKKKWTILDGKRCLIKGGSGATQQEPYNEVVASRMMDRLGIPHVPYWLLIQEQYPYSVCENFATPHTELVTAWYVMQTQPKPNHVSVHQHYLNCCEALGIPNMLEALDHMIVLDYIIANEDRHQNNFGVLRNAETLEWIGPAPIYDSGSSLWFSKPNRLISASSKVVCKPFKTDHEEQLKLVSSFAWLDLSKLDGIEDELRAITEDSLFIDAARQNALCIALRQRIEVLQRYIETHTKSEQVDDQHMDVTINEAYGGTTDEDDWDMER